MEQSMILHMFNNCPEQLDMEDYELWFSKSQIRQMLDEFLTLWHSKPIHIRLAYHSDEEWEFFVAILEYLDHLEGEEL